MDGMCFRTFIDVLLFLRTNHGVFSTCFYVRFIAFKFCRFHPRCVGLADEGTTPDNYMCPICSGTKRLIVPMSLIEVCLIQGILI